VQPVTFSIQRRSAGRQALGGRGVVSSTLWMAEYFFDCWWALFGNRAAENKRVWWAIDRVIAVTVGAIESCTAYIFNNTSTWRERRLRFFDWWWALFDHFYGTK